MFKTWTASNRDPDSLARRVEAHLNEFANEVVSVGYAVSDGHHHVMVVYRSMEVSQDRRTEAAVTLAEEIVEEAQA